MKELDGLRMELERLDAVYPRRELLTQQEAADFTGLSINTVKKYIPRNKMGKMSKYAVARYVLESR